MGKFRNILASFGYKPRISDGDFKRSRQSLHGKGISSKKLDKIETIFRGDMDEPGDQKGIDRKELAKGIEWMKENKSQHGLSDEQISTVEEEFKGRI